MLEKFVFLGSTKIPHNKVSRVNFLSILIIVCPLLNMHLWPSKLQSLLTKLVIIILYIDYEWIEQWHDHLRLMVFILDGCAFYYAHNRVNQAFRFVAGIWLHRKSRQIHKIGKDLFYIVVAQHFLSYHLKYHARLY